MGPTGSARGLLVRILGQLNAPYGKSASTDTFILTSSDCSEPAGQDPGHRRIASHREGQSQTTRRGAGDNQAARQ
ncbi:hypothetical protein ULG90_15510 [Halopseudomonas pachastrellae]|nr:hypothetical protein ULG90_15510 [Halopseudomonas pachastrellae]